MTLIQRFGSAANLNIHLHCLVLDGVYRISADGQLKFIEVPPPSEQALQTLLRAIIAGVMKRLVRQGALVQEHEDQWYAVNDDVDDEETSALRPLQQGSIVYRIAFGPRAGRKVLTLREATPIQDDGGYASKPLCANEQGFSLHASRDVALGVYATVGGVGAEATAAFDSISRCACTERQMALAGRAATGWC